MFIFRIKAKKNLNVNNFLTQMFSIVVIVQHISLRVNK